jgi:pimeloyl-ACP methyl ester carboxylesterase
VVRALAPPLFLATMAASCATEDRSNLPRRVATNGVEIAFRTFGPSSGEPILFIQGVGGTMPSEPGGFLRHLVDRGYHVIVFDNRDSGASTHLKETGAPGIEEIAAALSAGEPPPLPYTLRDMAGDAISVLGALSIDRAHLVGGSAGGMIAQLIAAEEPHRVASLTLISSTTNNPELHSGDESEPQEDLPTNLMRQGLAAGFAGDLRSADATIAAPAIIVHGTEDEVFPLEHGRDLAASIPGAELAIIDGMGHVPEDVHAAEIARLIESVVGRALR